MKAIFQKNQDIVPISALHQSCRRRDDESTAAFCTWSTVDGRIGDIIDNCRYPGSKNMHQLSGKISEAFLLLKTRF